MAFDGTSLFVAEGSTLSRRDVTSGAIPNSATDVLQGFSFVSALAYDGTSIWALDSAANNLKRIDPASAPLASNLTVSAPSGQSFRSLAYDGNLLWCGLSDRIIAVNTSTGAIVQTISLAFEDLAPAKLLFDGTHIWSIPSSGITLSRFDIATRTRSATYSGFNSATGLAFDGRQVWISNAGNGSLVRR